MEQACPLAVVQEPLTIEFARIPRDCEMDFVPSGLRNIQALKCAQWPVRTEFRMAILAVLDQGKVDVAGDGGPAYRPVAGPRFGPVRHLSKEKAESQENHPSNT